MANNTVVNVPTPDALTKECLDGLQTFALTLYGECRGEDDTGRKAVACVIMNRLKSGRWGSTVKGVCLWPWQFSCWSPVGGSANFAVVMATARLLLSSEPVVLPASLTACLKVANAALDGKLEDITKGSVNYLTEVLYANHPPSWALQMTKTVVIGKHLFFK